MGCSGTEWVSKWFIVVGTPRCVDRGGGTREEGRCSMGYGLRWHREVDSGGVC